MRIKFKISLFFVFIFLCFSFQSFAMKRNIDSFPPSIHEAKKFKKEASSNQGNFELCEHSQCAEMIDIYNCDPLTLIKHVSRYHFQAAIDVLFSSHGDSDSENEDIYTSCCHTAALLASIFLGEEKAKDCLCLLNRSETTQFHIYNDGQKLLQLNAYGLFDGQRICNALAKKSNNDDEKYYDSFVRILAKQSETLVPPRDISPTDFDNCFSNLRFSFNYDVLYELKRTLENNVSIINKDVSVAYIINIADGDACRHVFLIEQSLGANGVQYLLYQSWIAKIELADWFEQMEILDQKGIRGFLDRMKIILCDFDDVNANFSSCFGIDSVRGELLECRDGVLTGLSLRFLCYQIDPKSCGRNLYELMFNYDSDSSQ